MVELGRGFGFSVDVCAGGAGDELAAFVALGLGDRDGDVDVV
jgi:hypothetical protein